MQVLNMLLSVENLSMTFDKKTLYSNASFKVFKNDKIGVVGQNGVGKSTLIEILGVLVILSLVLVIVGTMVWCFW